ncbi:MAG: CDP-alcohol phosphatidyltransferase family protein, partial [Nitrospirota bacterium]|nr:CDP-alcohol phosphatidyltransferase family protein [Nitrospirota bacterium]
LIERKKARMPKDAPTIDAVDNRPDQTLTVTLNIPNSLTILRILLIPVIIGLLIYDEFGYALLTLIIAALTDALDGTIARLANQRTQFGAYLDPLADKLLLMSTFITFSFLDLVPVWSVIVVVSRDAILLTGTLLAQMSNMTFDGSPSLLGKATTLFQLSYIILVLTLAARGLDSTLLLPLLLTMSVLTVVSGLHYIYRGVTSMNSSTAS